MDVVNEGGSERADTESERDGRYEPARADPFAGHVGRDLEDDVADVEDGQHGVVVVATHAKLFLQTGDFGVALLDVNHVMAHAHWRLHTMLARSMKQNRYSSATVGTIMRSIFNRSLASALGSN
jgi:hypothetical protein